MQKLSLYDFLSVNLGLDIKAIFPRLQTALHGIYNGPSSLIKDISIFFNKKRVPLTTQQFISARDIKYKIVFCFMRS